MRLRDDGNIHRVTDRGASARQYSGSIPADENVVVTLIKNNGDVYRTIGKQNSWVKISNVEEERIITYAKNTYENGNILRSIDGGKTWYRIIGENSGNKELPTSVHSRNVELAQTQLNVYPNPTFSHLSIDITGLSTMNGTTLKLFDVSGNEMADITGLLRYDQAATFAHADFDAEQVSSGAYFLRLSDGINVVTTIVTIVR